MPATLAREAGSAWLAGRLPDRWFAAPQVRMRLRVSLDRAPVSPAVAPLGLPLPWSAARQGGVGADRVGSDPPMCRGPLPRPLSRGSPAHATTPPNAHRHLQPAIRRGGSGFRFVVDCVGFAVCAIGGGLCLKLDSNCLQIGTRLAYPPFGWEGASTCRRRASRRVARKPAGGWRIGWWAMTRKQRRPATPGAQIARRRS